MLKERLDRRPDEPAGTTRLSRWTVAIICVGVVVAIGLRLWILSSPLGNVDMDEAVSGLMGRHFSGGHISVFFWGQNYGGSQEAIATAALFRIVGSGRVALKVVPMLGYALSSVLVWRIGRRTIGEPQAAIAAVLFLLGPAFFVLRSTRAYGFYVTGLLVCCAVLLAVLRLRDEPSTLELAWLGFLLGIGWWATPQVAYVGLPAVVWLVVRAPHLLRRTHVVALGGIVGSSPWLLWSVTHHWASLHIQVTAADNTYGAHLRTFFAPLLPQALGLRVPYSGEWVLGSVVGGLVYAGLLIGFAFLLWKRPAGLELLLLVALAYPILYSVPPTSFYTGEPRYLFMLSPVLALLLARALRTPLRQVGAVAVVVALCVFALGRIDGGDPLNPTSTMDPLIAALDARHVDRVFAPYHIAYRLAFDSKERILATPIDVIRSPSLNDTVRGSASPAYVLVEGSPAQAALAAYLSRTGQLGDQVRVGLVHVYVPKTKLLPEQWRS